MSMKCECSIHWHLCQVLTAMVVLVSAVAPAQPRLSMAEPGFWPGSGRGWALSLRVTGQTAYVGLSRHRAPGGLAVVDISDPTKPVPAGSCELPSVANGLDIAGHYAYVADHSNGLQVVDVGVAAHPTRVGSYEPGGFAWDVRVVGQFAYMAVTGVGLVVVDVTDPAHPVSAGTFALTGWTKRLEVMSNYVYMTFGDRLEIIHVTDGTNLAHAASYRFPPQNGEPVSINDIQLVGRYAYAATTSLGMAGLAILDISNPVNPVLMGSDSVDGWGGVAIKVAGQYAYVADDTASLVLFDIGDPVHPFQVGTTYTGWFPHDLEVAGRYAFVILQSGLQVFDVSDPANPVRAGGYGVSGFASEVAVSGNYAYVSDGDAGLEIIDVSNPASPLWVAGYYTGGELTGLQLAGTNAFISDRDLGLLMLDVSNPVHPQLMAGSTNLGVVNGFELVDSFAYVACNGGLHVLDASSGTNLVEVGHWAPPDYFGGFTGVRVFGPIASVAIDRDLYTDQALLDVSDPAHPTFLMLLDNSGATEGSWIVDSQEVGHYLLVADSTSSLKVYDKSDPTNLVLAATFPTPGWVSRITLVGNYAYLSEGDAGVQVLDTSDPAHLVAVRTIDAGGPAYSAVVAGDLMFVAEGDKGLAILPVGPLARFTMQIDGTPAIPATIETTTDLRSPQKWIPFLTTNSSRMPFWFSDTAVQNGQKFYRVHQP